MTSRWIKKQQTRQAMIDGAMREIEKGRSFDSLGLREVTRSADIAATTFYRHFRDMEELGQGIVESVEETIQADARALKNILLADGESVRNGLQSIILAMQDHSAAYRLLLNLRMGPSPILQAAARRNLQLLTDTMASALTDLAGQRRRPVAQPDQAAEAIMSLIWGRAGDIMAPLHHNAETISSELLAGVTLVLKGAEQPVQKLLTSETA